MSILLFKIFIFQLLILNCSVSNAKLNETIIKKTLYFENRILKTLRSYNTMHTVLLPLKNATFQNDLAEQIRLGLENRGEIIILLKFVIKYLNKFNSNFLLLKIKLYSLKFFLSTLVSSFKF